LGSARGRRLIRPRALAGLLPALVALCGTASPAHAGAGPAASPSAAQALAIARAFAPTLVFHPDEPYFPTSAMAPGAPETWGARVDQYRALSMAEKLDRAAVAFRVFPYEAGAETEIVVEYWCYYVYNAYAIRGAWLPYKIADNHPHDLERLYFVLRPAATTWREEAAPDAAWARSSFQIARIVANAHNGALPPNQYSAGDRERLAVPVAILVERGSHAMAPDIDGDGRYTLGVDSAAHAKAVWGIRDNGSTWREYSPSFMDPRGASAIRLCGPAVDAQDATAGCSRYSLYQADELQRWYQELQLSGRDREDLVGRTPWFVRTFGDVKVEQLLAPTDAADGGAVDELVRRRTITETGFVVGFTTVDHTPTLVLSRRHFWEVPSAHSPDVLVEGVMLLPAGRRTMFEATAWASYKIDAITNVLAGFGYFTERHTASPILGAEIRLGRFRVRPNWRLADHGFDARVTTTFR
jgi:hypothetical protein